MFLRSLRMPQAQMGAFTSTAFPYIMQPAINLAKRVNVDDFGYAQAAASKAAQATSGLPTDPTNIAPGAPLTLGQNLTLTPGVQANATTPQVQQSPSNAQQGFDALDAAGLASPVAKIAMGVYNFSKGQQEKAVAKANEKMFKQDYMDRKEKMRDMFYTTPYTVGRSSDFTAQNGRIVLAQDGGMSAFQDFYNSQQAGNAQKLDMFKDVYKQTVDAQNQQAKMLKQQGLGQIAGGIGGIKDMAIQAAKTIVGVPPMQYGGVADWYQGDRTKLDKKQLLQKSLSKIKGNSDYVPFGVERLEDGTEVMYDPYAEYAEVMAKNGYRVVRSSERKGKTHKVIGPDGTVKFFGDSKLGQHPSDPERKKAFYARHAKNLKNNPYFRAFARKTWQEGGKASNDKDYNMERAIKLGYTPDEYGHWPSVDHETGMWLKSKEHPTAWMEYLYGYALNPETQKQFKHPIVNSEGYFGNDQLQYIPREAPERNTTLEEYRQGGKLNKLGVENSLWNNIRARRGSGKEPTKEMLEQERKIRREMQKGGVTPSREQMEDNDSWLENIVEVVDPSGVSSWDDVNRAYKNTGLSSEAALEVLGALPLLGKAGDILKFKSMLGKGVEGDMYNKKLLNTAKTLKGLATAGRSTDAVQSVLGAKDNSGFSWNFPYEGPTYNGRNILPNLSNENMYSSGGYISKMQIGGVTPLTFDQEDMYNFMEQQNQEPTLYDENFNDPELEQVMSQPSVVKQIVANQMSVQPEMEEEMFEYEQPLSTGSYSGGEDLLNSSNVIDRIAYNESRGRYDVVNTQTNTYGKYQFMEKYWADQIKNFMGLPQKTSSREVMETFKNSPESQDKFMNHVVNDIYMPRVVRLRSTARQYGLTDDDVIKLMHYRGVGEAEKMIRNGNFSVSREEQIKYKNPTVAAYLGKPVPGA